jgi:hypothetical protein
LRRIAANESQAHLDVQRLNYEVGQECTHAWQLLAYVIAKHLQADGTAAPLPVEVISDVDWKWIVERHSTRFVEILTAVPPALDRTPGQPSNRVSTRWPTSSTHGWRLSGSGGGRTQTASMSAASCTGGSTRDPTSAGPVACGPRHARISPVATSVSRLSVGGWTASGFVR